MYTAGLIESLAVDPRVDRITVLCHAAGANAPDIDRVEWAAVGGRERSAVGSLLSRDPSVVFRSSSHAFTRALDEAVRKREWDAVIVDGLAMAGAASHRALRFGQLVYIAHNHEESVRTSLADVTQRHSIAGLALELDAQKTKRAERRLVESATLVTAITEIDLQRFKQQAPEKRYLLLPPGYRGRRIEPRCIGPGTPRRVLLLGSFWWIAKRRNLEAFLNAAFPALTHEGIGVDIVGAMPPRLQRRLARRFPDADITGPTNDVTPYFDRARIGLVPEQIGGGFKLKTLDYIFNRIPIAALQGGADGTPLEVGNSMFQFDTMDQLVDGIIRLIDDFSRLNAVQEAAFTSCKDQFDWADRGRRLAQALAQDSNGIRERGTVN
jgi:polysaccharide biosynthesis protein PslH